MPENPRVGSSIPSPATMNIQKLMAATGSLFLFMAKFARH
jgi:hypothetical protein